MSQQQESGGVQPNVNPSLQPNHESGGVQLNVNPSLIPNHESGGLQPNVNPSLQPNHDSGGVQPNVNPSLRPNLDSVPRAGSSEEPQLSQPQSAVQELLSGGVQPNVNPGGSAHQQQLTEAQIAANYEIVRVGIEEIVRILLQHFPDLISNNVFLISGSRNILQAAVEYRQENIVNTIKDISQTATKNLSWREMESRHITLHLAGRLAPASKLFSVSGAALQMQRKLQWFKEVEKIAYPFLREWRNINNETATDVFRMEHKELAEKGEKWMKDTSNPCMLVSALIATVLFAAAFTVPGGNVDDNGIPIFLRTNAFTLFAISDALDLFSSLTSLLTFLAILTARYAVEDFLESLPKKLIIGLGSLFFAIAAMIIAFGATLTIVLGGRWHWVSVPITLVASFPVAIFVMLQLPLFIQMIQSTYGASIFHPWPSRV
ncbi:hypothetical protein LWI29_014618 [Acer saccharum]|uniref:PGG domain-containing protein n=1 Tax=Acer saccharum TaxID=4024 RepID=A0AA39VRS2_ACESA|nr:hypothetical protein LWI29_014618 [Acer saccharum]